MAAPVNSDYLQAFDITSLPYSTTQDVNDGGTTYTVWYKITPTKSQMISVWGFGDLTTYMPRMEVWKGDDQANHQLAVNVPGQVYVEAGQLYYFGFASDTGNVSPAILTLSVIAFVNQPMPAGSIIINDDRYDPVVPFPAAVVSRTTGEILGYLPSVTAGEMGESLADGSFAFENLSGANDDIARVTIYNTQLAATITVDFDPPPSGFFEQVYIGSDGDETFYIGWSGDTPSYQTLSNTGTPGSPVSLDGVTLLGLAASPDGSILYYTSMEMIGGSYRVKRWDIPGGMALSDLTSPLSGYLAKDILVMADGTVVVLYQQIADTNRWQARSYDNSGSLIQTFDYTAEEYALVRLTRGQDSDTFMFWAKRPVGHGQKGESYLFELDPLTGNTLTSVENNEFSHGTYSGAATETPPRFGVSESCPLLVTRAPIVLTSIMPLTGSLIDRTEPCPCPCECPAGGAPGQTGDILPPVLPDWTPLCEGGGTVPEAAELVDDEDWLAGGVPKSPDAWLEIDEVPYPTGDPSTLRWGQQALSDTGRFVEPRILEVGVVERGSSDKDGRYPPARLRVVAADDDAPIRGRLGDPNARHLLQREARYLLLSYAGRKAGLTPTPALRGRTVNIQPELGRRSLVEVQDFMGSVFGPLNPEKLIGTLIGDEHPNLPTETRGQIYAILYGEFSDYGAIDGNGDPADKGVIPARDCGDEDADNPGGTLPAKVGAPTLSGVYIGSASGSNTNSYAVVGWTEFGHTAISNIITISGLPSALDVDNYVELTVTPGAGSEFVIEWDWLGRNASTPNRVLDGTPVEETTYRDGRQGDRTDYDIEKPINLQGIPTAYASNSVWTWFALAYGYIPLDAIVLYGSNLADGEPPKRVRLTIGEGDIQIPEHRLVGGIPQTGFWARGTRVVHHRSGAVTFAANLCGYLGLNGLLINQVYRILLSFLNEFVALPPSEDFNRDIALFGDGTPIFWTSKFEAAQDATKTILGDEDGLGAIGTLAVTEPTALETILQRFFTSYPCGHGTSDYHGRWYPYVLLPNATPGGLLFKERQRIAELLAQGLAWDAVENKGLYSFHRDWDAQTFRSVENLFEDAASIAAHGGDPIGVFQRSVKECWYGTDPATQASLFAHFLTLYAYPPREVKWRTNLEPWAVVNGDQVRFAHRKEGLGLTGEAGTPGQLMLTRFVSQPYALEHTVRLFEPVLDGEET